MIKSWHKFDILGKDWLAICLDDDDDDGVCVCVCVCVCGVGTSRCPCGSLGETESRCTGPPRKGELLFEKEIGHIYILGDQQEY